MRIVDGEDAEFLEYLLRGIVKVSRNNSEALYEHITSLGKGPLMVKAIGDSLDKHPSLLALFEDFVDAYKTSDPIPDLKANSV